MLGADGENSVADTDQEDRTLVQHDREEIRASS